MIAEDRDVAGLGQVADQTARDPEDRRAGGDADLALALLDDEPEIRQVLGAVCFFIQPSTLSCP